MKKSKLLKNSTINKLIMGLSLMGILSAVSCDNEQTNEKTPFLQKVNLSANQTSEDIKKVIKTGTAYVKLMITKDEAGKNYAKYYKTFQDKNPKTLQDLTFPIQIDGSIEEFFIEASDDGNTYWVQRFDIYDKDPEGSGDKRGTLQYSLSKKKDFTLKTGDSDNNVTIDVVKQKEKEKISTSLKSPSFSVQTVEGFSFTVGFLKASMQWFGTSNDIINFTVKHGSSPSFVIDYSSTNLFEGTTKGNLIEITIPKSKEYYKDKTFTVEASVKRSVKSSVSHKFRTMGDDDANKQIKAGALTLKIINKFPAIKVTGGDGTNLYSDNNKTFNLGNVNNIKIFDPTDTDSDSLDANYKWILYKDGLEVTGAWIHPSTTTSTFKKLSLYTSPSIRPAGVMISQNTTLASQTDIDSYTLKGYAKADDGLGGITEKIVEFNFTK